MNIQSIAKFNFKYYFVLLVTISLFTFTSCGDKEEAPEKLDYATLMSGEYTGTLTVGSNLPFPSKATFSKGSTPNEMIFTEKIKRANQADSTTSLKIELQDLNSKEGIALRIPLQIIQGVTIVGTALKADDSKGIQGYFFYQDSKGTKLNEIVFLLAGNGGNYYYKYTKVE